MDFKLKNFGKIAEANIKLDGITVICGNNNTGKSTVGKALFSFYNSLYDYKTKINMQKYSAVRSFILSNVKNAMQIPVRILDEENPISFINSHLGEFTVDEVKSYLESNFPIKVTKEKVVSLVEYLNLPESDIINEYVFRYFGLVMNNQTKNLHSANRSQCSVFAKIKDNEISITLRQYRTTCFHFQNVI